MSQARGREVMQWLVPATIAMTTAATTTVYFLSQEHTRKSEKTEAPELKAGLQHGFCGHNDLLVSRLPVGRTVTGSSWENILHLFHEEDARVTVQNDDLVSSKDSWNWVPRKNLDREGSVSGVLITRTSLIALLLLSNARIIYEYSDSSGYRAALGSWTGQWYINWSAERPATVTLKAHDSHSASTDVYPPTFRARVDRAIQMMAGVVVNTANPSSIHVAFPGRLASGRYKLEHQPKGFGLSHGSRHIYNMSGGKVFEIDFLFTRPLVEDDNAPEGQKMMTLPSSQSDQHVSLYIARREMEILAHAMDCLPWANLSWSIHRGMRDLLLAYSSNTMEKYRPRLAEQLRKAAKSYHIELVDAGWNPTFARDYMGDMAASAVLAGRGNSGDAVRIVTALTELIYPATIQQRDETSFWRQHENLSSSPITVEEDLEPEAVTALVKCFIIEWSVDFNYQMYHQLPMTLFLS